MSKAYISFYGNIPVTGGLLTFLLARTSCLSELKYTLKYVMQGCAVSKETESCHLNQSNKYEMHVSISLTVCNPRLIILAGFRLAPRQSCCWCARQISLPWGSSKHLSPTLENGRDLPMKCLMWYWTGPQAVINSRQSLAVWWLLSVLFYAHWMPKTDVPSQYYKSEGGH